MASYKINGADWRSEAHRIQRDALPEHGEVVLSCAAPLGSGGLGRHSAEILDACGRRGLPACYVSEARGPSGALNRTSRRRLIDRALMPVTYARPSVRTWKESVLFDRDAATRLPACEHFMGFNGTSLAQLLAARRGGARSVSLIAANPHFSELSRQHARAFSQYPVDRSYAGRLVARNLREYALADVIYVASSYVWDTFVREGTPEERLRLFPLTPAPRFVPGPAAEPHDTFNVVFVGALTADKGVPLLVDAFGRLTHPDMRLVLVGGWKTNAMKRYLQRARAADPRIELHVGDPLPHLHAAGVYAHPAYAEGFGYAAAEALACGVPLLVSETTGMKDLMELPRDGVVLPTGDAQALAEALACAYRGELPGG